MKPYGLGAEQSLQARTERTERTDEKGHYQGEEGNVGPVRSLPFPHPH